MGKKITNLSLQNFRYALRKAGCEVYRTSGGHEMWGKQGLLRPIVVQSHIDPVPARIVKQAIRALGITTAQFFDYLES